MTDVKPPALILAGGRSLRMGAAKAWLPFGSGTLLSHILERLAPQVSEVVLNAPPTLPAPDGMRTIDDTLAGQPGPLAGVLAGLRDLMERGSAASHLLTVPSDAPFLPLDLAARLTVAAQPDTIVVAASLGQQHPVFGLWPVSLAGELEAWLSTPENRRLSDFLSHHRTVTVEWPATETAAGPLDPFMNLNTPSDVKDALCFLEVQA